MPKEAKYEDYQLDGEKENYKEVLVTMPKKYSEKERSDAEDRGIMLPTNNEKNVFSSSHFSEPNILVHLRMNTRTDADGNKVLLLEEVQSDWGQTGKKEGFANELKEGVDFEVTKRAEDFLLEFKGCLLIVSHDRYFLDKLTDHLFIFEGNGKVRGFLGNYNEYRIQQKEEQRLAVAEEKNKQQNTDKPSQTIKRKLSFKEQTEFAQLEKDIEQLNAEKLILTEKLSHASADHTEIQKLASRIEEIILSLDKKELRWLELSEFV